MVYVRYMATTTELADGQTLRFDSYDGGYEATLEDPGGVVLVATFSAPDGVVDLDDWCPGSPSGVTFSFVPWVPIGREGSAGITTFVWQSAGRVLYTTIMGGWNAHHRDAAEALLRERLTERAEALPVKPGRGVAGEPYYSALLELFAYAAQRHDHPAKLVSEVCHLAPATLRTRLERARALGYARWRADTGQTDGLRTRLTPPHLRY
jgi:hypothetical protein